MSEVKEIPKRVVVLNPQRIALAEQWRQDWVVNVEEGTLLDDVMDHAYWSHCSATMQPFDRIEARMETGEWVADLIVTAVGRNWATVHLIAKHDLQPDAEAPIATVKHKVIWRGAQHKFCIQRLADNEILQAGLDSKAAGIAWLDNYEKTLQAA